MFLTFLHICQERLLIGLWTVVATYLILKVINMFSDIRVSSEGEEEGLDVFEHNEQGYSL